MAGSLTWREYITDTGDVYSIKIDKSNSRLINTFNGESLTQPRGFNAPQLPLIVKPRVLYLMAANSIKIRRTVIVGNPKALVGQEIINGGGVLNDLPVTIFWIITGYRGERILRTPIYYTQPDTGLDDGTVSQ